jgi:hypothetical protein
MSGGCLAFSIDCRVDAFGFCWQFSGGELMMVSEERSREKNVMLLLILTILVGNV